MGSDYRVGRLLGSGGMGHVYVAHNLRLNLAQAIKVLRPELDTAEGSEGFLREARTLASVRHPNVVVIYDWGEGEGLKYYFMELVGGPTLGERLKSSPISMKQAVQIGVNLLDGLEQLHLLGFVHRDIKPSNVFLLPNRALLGDFGITRPSGQDDEDNGGTAAYKAPEQAITPRVDIYSTGVVLYEAVKGRKFHEQGANVDWSDIPDALASVLRRAVAEKPEDRWPDAAGFRHALERTLEVPPPPPTQARPPWMPITVAIASVLAVAIIAVLLRPDRLPPPNPSNPNVAFRIEYGGPAGRRPIGDSLLRMVQSDLNSHINFVDAQHGSLPVLVRMTVTGGDVRARVTAGNSAAEFHVPVEHWSTLRDSIGYQIGLGIRAVRPFAASLPPRGLPRTSEGLLRFLEAEQFEAQAQWKKADSVYRLAEAADSTCWLCAWRITEVGRWLSREPDPERVRRYLAHADSLPPLYRSLIRASHLPLRDRLDTLRAAAERSREVFLGWFQLGDELFHRGPLTGHRRSEAISAFERAARLQPDYRPSWEHLTWVATAEGDSSNALNALDSLESRTITEDARSHELRALLHVGFAWRFLSESTATKITRQIVSDPATERNPDFAAGPRMLPTFDVPRGAIALGEMLAQSPERHLQRSGLIAQALGALALGRVDSTRALEARLMQVAPEPALDFFSAELQAALAVLDSEAVSTEDARDGLRVWLLSSDAALRDRAAWMSSLLEGRSRLMGASPPRELRLAITAESLAAVAVPRAALRLLDKVNIDSVARHGDPFFRALARFRRAEWRAQIGDVEGAKAELIWHEHLDLAGLPTGLPQAAEVDWSFGTLARWRLARMIDGTGRARDDEACNAYAAVLRNWTGSPAPYGARADTAQIRLRALNCVQ